MARKIIRIDTYIGRWGYGKELLRFDLEGTLEEGALLQISSFGGDLFHALDMYNQVAAHGNVEVVFTGPSASAATILAMAAKKISIVDNCFLLVHKAMAGVDNYGLFNEDELEGLIRDLKALQQENRQFDKAIAHIYAKRTGRSHEEMISSMKANTWITAQDALDLGLVDQIIEPGQKIAMAKARLVAMARDSELPPFPGMDAGVLNNAMNPEPENENQYEKPMRQFPLINKTIDTGSLESSEEGCYLNPSQLEAIERTLESAMQSQFQYETAMAELEESRRLYGELAARVESLTAERDTAMAERNAARELQISNAEIHQATADELSELNAALDAIDPSVKAFSGAAAKAEAIRLLLARKPGAGALGIFDSKDRHPGKDGVDWELINSLPHNQDLDKNL